MAFGVKFFEGIDGEAGAGAANLAVVDGEVGVASERQPQHRQPVGGGCWRLAVGCWQARGPGLFVGVAGGEEADGLGAELEAGAFGEDEVSDVRRIEGAAEQRQRGWGGLGVGGC